MRPQGARHLYALSEELYRIVSIHAPQGARLGVILNAANASNSFNSCAHKGRDIISQTKLRHHIEFQFTRPQGARQQ